MTPISNTQRYTLGGFLFGLLFPFFSWILDGLFFHEMSLSLETVVQIHRINPIHFVIDSAPFVLGGAFGTIGFYIDRLKENSDLRHSNIEKYNAKNKAIIQRMRLANTFFPILIGLILVAGFLLLQDFSYKEQDDIHLIKIGSNQSTLSQKILYHSSRIPVTLEKERIRHIDSLLIALKNFKEGHENLTQKSFTLGISKEHQNSQSVRDAFDTLASSYENIVIGIDELLNPTFAIENVDSLSLQNHEAKTVRTLEKNQEEFSSRMQSIINNYEQEAKDKVTNLKIVQFVVVVVIMIFVIALSVFGLKPMIERVKQAFFDVEEANAKSILKNERLEASQEELRMNAEELRSINDNLLSAQDEIEQKQDLLNRAEKMAKMGSFVWDLETELITHSDNLPSIYRLEKGQKFNSATFREIVHPEDYKINQLALAEAATRNQKELLTHYRARPTHLSEKEDWKHYRAFSLINYNNEGEPYLLIGTAQDVTQEIVQNEKVKILFDNVEKNKERLEESQLLAKIVSYDMNIESEEIEWSASFEGIFQIDKKDFPNSLEEFRSWIEPKDLKRVVKKWEEAIENKEKFSEVYRIHVPKRATLYIKEKAYPSFDENDILIGKRGTLQDITKSEIFRLNIEQKSRLIKQQNDNFVSSVNYAQRIQFALLGSTREMKSIFKDSFVFFTPKDIVSGDFFWYAEVDNRKVIIVADCTGHGVPGAFMSLLGITLLNEIVKHHKITKPSEILDTLQREIIDILKQKTTGNKDGMDISIAVIDSERKILEFAGAKNPLVYMHKKRQRGGEEKNMTVIKGDAVSIGGRNKKVQDKKYTNHVIDLEEVETFYLYSDGYQDQFGGEEGRKFMSKRFRSLLYETSTSSMLHQRRALKMTLMDWIGTEQKQIDDICIIGITV
ncbi:SpoIIE family protein phosphatase [Bernardetia sp. MNP-M8]|uniref:SpoIIE family protein phosphatase n=1 Tax=Bernardetia sp. MNP-M8 TaxID=3127470 RepID=UPI0030CE59A0